MRYDRAGLESHELWRLLTAHFVHLDLSHAALNVAGLGLVWALFFGDYAPKQWLAILAAAVLAIDAGLWFFEPQLAWYVRGDWDRWILVVFLAGKLAWEQTQGALPLGALHGAMTVVVEAHLYGALGGVLAALWLRPKPRPL